MNIFINLLEKRISFRRNKRLRSVDDYVDYLNYLGFAGRIDDVYFSLKVQDKTYVQNNQNELLKHSVFKNLASLIKKEETTDTYGIQQFLLNKHTQPQEVYAFLEVYLENLSPYSATHEENFILHYLLNIALLNKVLTSELSIKLVEYFWSAKNCNNYRKDSAIFSIVDCRALNNDVHFFTLREQFYNHIQKIYSQIYRSSLILDEERVIYQTFFNSLIKKNNKLKLKTNIKVAVCMSGLYRDHIEAIENIKRNLTDPLGADVFIHTWDKKDIWIGNGGSPHITRLFSEKARSYLPQEIDSLSKLEKALPSTYEIIRYPISEDWDGLEVTDILEPKKIIIESQDDFESSLEDIDNYKLSRGSLNQIKMFYGIKKSFDLALNHSDYDYIIRVRPDTLVGNKVSTAKLEDLQNNVIYTGVSNVGMFDADFTISTSMAYGLSSLIEKMFESRSLSPFEYFPLYDSHNLLLAWLVRSNYTFDKPIFKRRILNTSENKVCIDGLRQALDNDLKNLSSSDKNKMLPFVNYLKEYYT